MGLGAKHRKAAAAGRARARCGHSGIRAEGRGRPPDAARLGCPRRARCAVRLDATGALGRAGAAAIGDLRPP